MWRRAHSQRAYYFHRAHLQARAAEALTRNSSARSPYDGQAVGAKPMVANDKVVFIALGTFFGLMFVLFGIQIYVRCIWRRLRTEVVELEDESEDMTRADIYIREIGAGRRNWRRRLNHYFDERSDSSSPAQHAPVGLHKSELELLPTFEFSANKASRDGMVCAVCLEEFVDSERCRLLPKCSHCFHVQCIDMWFLSHSSCPLCRCEVSSPDVISHPLLQNSQRYPHFSHDRSEQQQDPEPSPPPSTNTEVRDPAPLEECPSTSSSLPDAGSSSIVSAFDSYSELYLERGSSISRRAAAIALEMADQGSSNGQQPDEVELLITPEASSDISLPGSQSPDCPPVLCLEYQPELHPSTSAPGTPRRLEADAGSTPSSVLMGSPSLTRNRSYLAVEIMDEHQPAASGILSQMDSSSHPRSFFPVGVVKSQHSSNS